MDLGFSRLEPDGSDVTPLQLDYWRLVACLAAMQAASRTATAEMRLAGDPFAGAHPVAALVELLVGGPDWRAAATALEGAFHPELASENLGFPP